MLLTIIRTAILFLILVIALRVMGKRQVGQLQPYELAVTITIADLAVVPMESTSFPLISGIVPIFVLVVLGVILSYVSLKSIKMRGIICGRPSIIIQNGKIVEQELTGLRYDINDLLEQLRIKNVPNVADVEFAILETSGSISVIPKSQKRPLNPEDMNIPTKYEGIPMTLIIDGHVLQENLNRINLNTQWLQGELDKFGINDLKKVLFASLDTNGNLFYQIKTS